MMGGRAGCCRHRAIPSHPPDPFIIAASSSLFFCLLTKISANVECAAGEYPRCRRCHSWRSTTMQPLSSSSPFLHLAGRVVAAFSLTDHHFSSPLLLPPPPTLQSDFLSGSMSRSTSRRYGRSILSMRSFDERIVLSFERF